MSADPTATDTAWVGLGSNLGHRGQNLARLRDALSDNDVKIVARSAEILTRPVGVTAQGEFHNQVVRLRSPAPWQPRMWLTHCKDFMAYIGTWEPKDFYANAPGGDGRALFQEMTDKDYRHLWDESLRPGAERLESWNARSTSFAVCSAGSSGAIGIVIES